MDGLVDDLLGDPDDEKTDHARVKTAHDALLAAGAGAVPALRRGLERAVPSTNGRERLLTVLVQADDRGAREAVRKVAAEAGDEAAVAALAARAIHGEAEEADLRALARSPGLGAHLESLLADWRSRPGLGNLIAAFVRHHAASAADLRAAAGRKGASAVLGRFAAEVDARARGKSTGWPPPAKKGGGDELTPEGMEAARKAGLFES